MRTLKILLLAEVWILIFALTLLATDVSGPVSGTWTLSGSPYNVIGQISIPAGQELVIEPGVQVIFQGWHKFLIYGRLQAVGTEADSITFTAIDTTHGWHGLRFYDINTQPDSSRLVYCKITYGKSSSVNTAGDDKNGGVIFCSNSGKLRIEHCLIAHNQTGDVVGATGAAGTGGLDPGDPGESARSGEGGAVYMNSSNILISFCRFLNNHTGQATGGVGGDGWDSYQYWAAWGSDGGPGGSGNSGGGGALLIAASLPVVISSLFESNYTGDGQGGAGGEGGLAWSSSPYIGEALAGDGGNGGAGESGTGGALFFDSSTVLIVNCLFSGNYTGSGSGGAGGNGGWAWCEGQGPEEPGDGGDGGNGIGGSGAVAVADSGFVTIQNTTMIENLCGQGIGGIGGLAGGSYMPPGSPGLGVNGEFLLWGHGIALVTAASSIFWGNNTPLGNGIPQVDFSCIEGGYPGIGNISSDPLFVGTSLGDYFLSQLAAGQTQQSPCVDAGDPSSGLVAGTTRTDGVLDGGIVDMGYHYPQFVPQPILSVVPDSLDFLAWLGGGNPVPQDFQVMNIGTGGMSFELAESIDWLAVQPFSGGPIFGSNPQTVAVSIEIAGLPIGQYDGYIVVTAPGAVGSPDSVHISLEVGQTALAVSADSLTFIAGLGGPNPPNQIFTINNPSIGQLFYAISENSEWLTVSPLSGGPVPPAATITVAVDITGLSEGEYSGSIIVEAPYAIGSPDTVAVYLVVGQPILNVIAGPLIFNYIVGNPPPASQAFQISNSGTGVLYYQLAESALWLSLLSMAGGPVPPTSNINVNVNPSGWIQGTYETTIQISAQGALGSPDTLHVTLNITGLSGNLSGTLEPGEYPIMGNISISSGNILTLEPGVTFLFQPNTSFSVFGVLSASGTIDDSIKFIRGMPSGPWGGINVYGDASGAATFEYCLISGASGSGLLLDEISPVIRHCLIEDNSAPSYDPTGGGIYCFESAAPLIEQCLIRNNIATTGGGIACRYSSNPSIEGCTIIGNSATIGGGIACEDSSSPRIDSCLIIDNYAVLGGGIACLGGSNAEIIQCEIWENQALTAGTAGLYFNSSVPLVQDCNISDNLNGGICFQSMISDTIRMIDCQVSGNSGVRGGLYGINATFSLLRCIFLENSAETGSSILGSNCNMFIERCTFSNNISGSGGVIRSSTSSAMPRNFSLKNCTLADNQSADGAIYLAGSALMAEINYSDFFNNVGGDCGGLVPSGFGIVEYANINGDPCDIYDNIFLDPLFANPDTGDFHLTAESPCIDAGDPASPLDPDSTIADMGAFYFDHVVGIAEPPERFVPETFFLEGNHPNPFNPVTTITFGLPVASWVKVEVFDIAGRKVGLSGSGTTPTTGFYEAGVHEVTFDGSDLASGIYVMRLQAGSFRAAQKLILLK